MTDPRSYKLHRIDFEGIEGRLFAQMAQRCTDATNVAVEKAFVHMAVRLRTVDLTTMYGDEFVIDGNEENYEPRTDEEPQYVACLLALGAGPSFRVELGSNQLAMNEAMAWARSVDEWWIEHVYEGQRPVAIGEDDPSYRFRRRFLNWCKEKSGE